MLVPRSHRGLGATLREFTCLERRISPLDYNIAILGSVHGGIGAVSPVGRFGSPEQQARWLPELAWTKLSAFALTESSAGSDTQACKLTGVREGSDIVVHGEKLFITNVIIGEESQFLRLVSLVLRIDGKFQVGIIMLPEKESAQFNHGKRYTLNALARLQNHRLVFNGFRFPAADLLPLPEAFDGRVVALWSLALGRTSLGALSDGAIAYLGANIAPWCEKRQTFGRPLADRQQIQWFAGRIAAAGICAYCLTDAAASLFDQGFQIELEAMMAKIQATDAVTGALSDFKFIHGGRIADRTHPYARLAQDVALMQIYEGANPPLSMNWLKTLLKINSNRFIMPLITALQQHNVLDKEGALHWGPAMNPKHWSTLWRAAWPYLKLKLAAVNPFACSEIELPPLPPALAHHVRFALHGLKRARAQVLSALERHGKNFYNMQCAADRLSRDVQSLFKVLVIALRAGEENPELHLAADVACDMIRRELHGGRPSTSEDEKFAALGRQVIAGRFPLWDGIEPDPIVLNY